MLLDTCFLIDLQRERRRGKAGGAHDFAESRRGERSFLSVIAWGEFAEGFAEIEENGLMAFRNSFEILPIDEPTAWQYSRIVRVLRSRGQLIGSNDLWIAATALAHGMPLVTRNAAEFGKIPGLGVIVY